MSKIWIVKSKDSVKDYFTSAKKAREYCEFWIETVKGDVICSSSDPLSKIKTNGFGWVYSRGENICYTIDSSILR